MYSQYQAALSATIARGACDLWRQNIRLSMRRLRKITADAVTGSILSWVGFSLPHRPFRTPKDSCPYFALRSCSDSRLAACAALCLPIHHFDFLFAFSCALHSTCCHHPTKKNHQEGFLIIGVCPLAAFQETNLNDMDDPICPLCLRRFLPMLRNQNIIWFQSWKA